MAACTAADGAARLDTARTCTLAPPGDGGFLATGLFGRAASSCGWGEPRFGSSGEPSRAEPRLTLGEVAFIGDRPFRIGLLFGVPAFFGLAPVCGGDSWIVLGRPCLEGDLVAPTPCCVGRSR